MRRYRWRLVRSGRLLRLERWEGDEPADGALFQERLRETPFWMLVACSLVNLTIWSQAQPALADLMLLYPSPKELAGARVEDLEGILRPLGLWKRRAVSLSRLAQEWLRVGPPGSTIQVAQLPGCGKYAADSWAIFVEGRTDVDPTDGKLSWYLNQLRSSPCPQSSNPPTTPASSSQPS